MCKYSDLIEDFFDPPKKMCRVRVEGGWLGGWEGCAALWWIIYFIKTNRSKNYLTPSAGFVLKFIKVRFIVVGPECLPFLLGLAVFYPLRRIGERVPKTYSHQWWGGSYFQFIDHAPDWIWLPSIIDPSTSSRNRCLVGATSSELSPRFMNRRTRPLLWELCTLWTNQLCIRLTVS